MRKVLVTVINVATDCATAVLCGVLFESVAFCWTHGMRVVAHKALW